MNELDIKMAETLMALDGLTSSWSELTEFSKTKWEARVQAVMDVIKSAPENA